MKWMDKMNIKGEDEPPVLDLRGYQCPLPVLKTRKRLSTMADGDCIWVLTDDPLASLDLPNFCQESGHHLIEQVEDAGGCLRFLLRCQAGRQAG